VPSKEPVTIATDGAYPTPGNQELVEIKNVHIVSTNMPGKKVNDFYVGFELSDDGKIILACSGGIGPFCVANHTKMGKCGWHFLLLAVGTVHTENNAPHTKGSAFPHLSYPFPPSTVRKHSG
jgi:hypothetical protein